MFVEGVECVISMIVIVVGEVSTVATATADVVVEGVDVEMCDGVCVADAAAPDAAVVPKAHRSSLSPLPFVVAVAGEAVAAAEAATLERIAAGADPGRVRRERKGEPVEDASMVVVVVVGVVEGVVVVVVESVVGSTVVVGDRVGEVARKRGAGAGAGAEGGEEATKVCLIESTGESGRS